MKQTIYSIKRTGLVPCIPVLLLTLFVLVSGVQKAAAQDNAFTRLKQAAQGETTEKTQLSKVRITTSNPNWKAVSKTAIPYQPLPMKDANGRTLQPDEMITLKNGTKMTAQDYYAKLNEIEKKLNAQGYSLRSGQNAIVSKTVTATQDLDGKVSSMPVPVSPLRSEENLKVFMNPEKKVGNLVLKPMEKYSAAEKSVVKSTKFAVNNEVITAAGSVDTSAAVTHSAIASRLLKTINETTTKEWSFGNSNTFKAGIKGTLTRYAKIYNFDPTNPDGNMDEFKVSAEGKVYGALFGNSVDLLKGNAEVFAPSNTSKKITAKLVIKLGTTTILNLNESYSQSKNLSGIKSRSIDKSFSIEVPIVAGINFSGRIGIRGTAGLEYGASIYRTFASLQARPLAEIAGYAEAGVGVSGLAEIGVGGNLTFIKGDLELQGFAGIWTQNATQVVVAYSYYFGYNLEMLNGNMYVYAELLFKKFEHDLFSWSGYKKSGTIAEGSKSYVLANI